ncbi:hypothetical protein KHA94_08430 [Bacillus sp. FJAT-49705]|uniref:Polysaccharide chain length determinant N-terminal domain-containing protein n=1 Tax=Cytobacillus citreus TaxID=2833586 RepID=A0ABS5NQX6_9BACI|nr:hypothetical protein [Cytobacillus citreus]MBS4190227.1 hypothetical protein [Cytobacillus citreus]
MAEQKKFVLYEYLVFFWKKKVFFLIIPLLFTLLGFGASYVIPNKGNYVGSAKIFTGGVSLKGLKDPSYLVDQFGEDVNGELEAFVSSDSFIKIKIYNDDKEELEKDLHKMTSAIEKAMLENYNHRTSITEGNIKNNEKELDELIDVLEVTNDQLKNGQLNVTEAKSVASVLEQTEARIAEVQARNQRMTGDIDLFESPGIASEEVKAVDKNQVELSLAGLVLGIFATFLILMLWKYVNEARRYYNHD